MSIAIIGAGIQGCCVALELASRGRRVQLFDRADLPMTEASRWNEGKIHLGYVYAKDDTLATAKAMLAGSFVFGRVMERLVGANHRLPRQVEPLHLRGPQGQHDPGRAN